MITGASRPLGHAAAAERKGDRVYAVNQGQSIEKDYGKVGTRFQQDERRPRFPHRLGSCPDGQHAGTSSACSRCRSPRKAATARSCRWTRSTTSWPKSGPTCSSGCTSRTTSTGGWSSTEGESPTLHAPIFTFEDRLEARFFKFYIPKGYEVMGQEMSQLDTGAIEYMESVMNREGVAVYFSMKARRHAVREQQVHPAQPHRVPGLARARRRRHLIRLWLKFLGSTRQN